MRRRLQQKLDQANQPLRKGETRSRCVRLLGGLVLWVAALYCGPRSRTGNGRGSAGAGLYPQLAAFGFSDGDNTALVSTVARQCVLAGSFDLARRELDRTGLDLDIKTVHRIARRLGVQALTARRLGLLDWRAGLVPRGTELAGKRVGVAIDGGRIRLRRVTRKQKGKGKKKGIVSLEWSEWRREVDRWGGSETTSGNSGNCRRPWNSLPCPPYPS